MEKEKVLSVTKPFDIRFSEVDSMGVVWHGHYAIYFEDAREAFGAKYGLEYLMMYGKGYFEPIVELTFKYKRVLIYGMKPEITITYRPCEAAKIIFDYEIRDTADDSLLTSARTIQAFTDQNYQLILENPEFDLRWKQEHGLI